MFANYYKKEQILGLFSPKDSKNKYSKMQAVHQMIIALECIAENGDLPKHIGKTARARLLENTSVIRERCLLLVCNNGI